MPSKNSSQVVLPEDWQNGGFGLYIHWPFCMAKCPYCDFNSHVAKTIDQERWAKAYVKEINRIGAETKDKVLRSVFFGGGTPSLMSPKTVAIVLDAVRATWRTENDVEITLEANPTSVEAGRFRGYAQAGVNRLSMGIQALNDTDLRALGRMHSAEEALRAFDIARTHIDRVSFDLIYGRQNQSVADWEVELRQALSLAVDHLSLYQLTIEDGTAFGDRYRLGKLRGLPDEDRAADLWDVTQSICNDHGFPAYEVSNHAKHGHESRHNKVYWQYGDYAGIGPGAHGRLTLDGRRFATEAPKAPGAWLELAEADRPGEYARETLSVDDQATEFLLMGLRLTNGIDRTRLSAMVGDKYDGNIQSLVDAGLLFADDRNIKATEAGRPLLNGLLRELLRD
ncbi:MAG: coproporphyrinogen III oxidase [Rhodobacteraceae bacterium]|nr:coproporphyrinogen III oxidase [Paracoccaceae bacterium]